MGKNLSADHFLESKHLLLNFGDTSTRGSCLWHEWYLLSLSSSPDLVLTKIHFPLVFISASSTTPLISTAGNLWIMFEFLFSFSSMQTKSSSPSIIFSGKSLGIIQIKSLSLHTSNTVDATYFSFSICFYPSCRFRPPSKAHNPHSAVSHAPSSAMAWSRTTPPLPALISSFSLTLTAMRPLPSTSSIPMTWVDFE